MASDTTHKEAYRKWSNAHPAVSMGDRHVRMEPPPFEGKSTYRVRQRTYI